MWEAAAHHQASVPQTLPSGQALPCLPSVWEIPLQGVFTVAAQCSVPGTSQHPLSTHSVLQNPGGRAVLPAHVQQEKTGLRGEAPVQVHAEQSRARI